MRKANSIKNAIISAIMNIITIIFGFVAQKVFIITLGNEYLGLNGLFSNILSMLSIAELGFGSAIIYHLYKPVANNDEDSIKSLIKFYKKTYNLIALIILIGGMLITPFLPNLIGNLTIECNLYFLFLLALFDVVVSYLLTYKRSILYATQKNYILNLVHILYVIFVNVFEIVTLFLYKNYVIYLIIKIIFRFLENIVINFIVNKQYPFLRKNNAKDISEDTKKDIIQKVKGLIYHKIGRTIVLGTDNIIISSFLGVTIVGLYSNYYMIINAVNNLFGQVFSSISGSVGNLLIKENSKKTYNIYKSILLANSWLYCVSATCILSLMQSFIKIWLGESFILSYSVLVILVINFYVQGIEKTSILFKEAGGIFYEDRYIPLIEAIVNIVFSIIFVKYFGLFGVFLGTFMSTLILFLYSYPIFVYKKIFKKPYLLFFKDLIKHILIFTISLISIYILNLYFSSCEINIIIKLIIELGLGIIVPNIIYFVSFRKKDEYKYFENIIKRKIKA